MNQHESVFKNRMGKIINGKSQTIEGEEQHREQSEKNKVHVMTTFNNFTNNRIRFANGNSLPTIFIVNSIHSIHPQSENFTTATESAFMLPDPTFILRVLRSETGFPTYQSSLSAYDYGLSWDKFILG